MDNHMDHGSYFMWYRIDITEICKILNDSTKRKEEKTVTFFFFKRKAEINRL